MLVAAAPLATARHIRCLRVLASQRPKPVIGRLPYERLEPEPDRFGVSGGASGRFRLTEQVLVDVQGLLYSHMN